MKETCQYGPLNAEQEYNEHATMTVHHACSCAIMCIDDFHKILDLNFTRIDNQTASINNNKPAFIVVYAGRLVINSSKI